MYRGNAEADMKSLRKSMTKNQTIKAIGYIQKALKDQNNIVNSVYLPDSRKQFLSSEQVHINNIHGIFQSISKQASIQITAPMITIYTKVVAMRNILKEMSQALSLHDINTLRKSFVLI